MTVGMFKKLARTRNWPDNALIDVRYYDFEDPTAVFVVPATITDGVVDWSASGDFEGNTHTVTLMTMTYDELAEDAGI